MTRSRDAFGNLWGEMNRVQDEFNRLFGRFAARPGAVPTGPLANVWEDEHALHASFDLPDVDPAALDVSVTEGNQLTVSGERKAPDIGGATWVRQERPYGPFSRVVGLPALVDADKVEAKYENGVLRLTLPKHEAAKPRKITVKPA